MVRNIGSVQNISVFFRQGRIYDRLALVSCTVNNLENSGESCSFHIFACLYQIPGRFDGKILTQVVVRFPVQFPVCLGDSFSSHLIELAPFLGKTILCKNLFNYSIMQISPPLPSFIILSSVSCNFSCASSGIFISLL